VLAGGALAVFFGAICEGFDDDFARCAVWVGLIGAAGGAGLGALIGLAFRR